MDNLFHRSMEFHNNEHSFNATSIEFPLLESHIAGDLDQTALYYHQINRTGTTAFATAVTLQNLAVFMPQISSNPGNNEILWIHLKDLRCMKHIAECLNMHELCSKSFFDLRAHSSAIATSKSLVFTMTTLHLHKEITHLYKVYVYAANGVIVTFERELIQDELSLDLDADKGYMEDLIYKSMLSKLSESSNNFKMGVIYFVYEIVMETLTLSNPVLEFMSRSVYYLRQQVHKKLSYQERLINHRKIHILISAINMLDRHISEWTAEVKSFLIKTSTIHFLLHESLSNVSHQPYFHDMGDSYEYRSMCLKSIQADLLTLLETMDAIINVRAQQTNVNLSLVATIFLPVTFLAGVFGMNFVEVLLKY